MKNRKLHWFYLPAISFVIHLFAVFVFSLIAPDLAGPHTDVGANIWLCWAIIDFPIGILAVQIGAGLATNLTGVLTVAFIGGIQWILWGFLLTAIIRSIQSRIIKN